MGNFSESLTVRILGDSSQLQRELETVSRSLDGLSNKLSQLTNIDQQLGQSVSRVTSMLRPVSQLSRLLDRIANQARTISRTPIQLNVAPAIRSLGLLSQMILRVGALLRRLSATPVRIPIPFSLPTPRLPIRRLVAGGLVTGPGGIDKVPALLSAGEFVLRQPVVDRLGLSFLERLNQNRTISSPQQSISTTQSESSSQINIHERE